MWHRLAGAILLLTMALAAASASASPPAQAHPPVVAKADRVLVVKNQRRLFLFREGRLVAGYRIALGANPVGPKFFEGDGRTPEGSYVLNGRNENSRFHRSIRISYPSPADRQRAWRYGGPPGGDIMIHGQPGPGNKSALKRIALAPSSWTDGCIAVDNAAMDQIWAAVDDGTPIEILP